MIFFYESVQKLAYVLKKMDLKFSKQKKKKKKDQEKHEELKSEF